MARTLCESDVEEYIISKLESFGYDYLNNEDDEFCWASARQLDEFINDEVLKNRLVKINKGINLSLIDDAITTIKRISESTMFERNRVFHSYLVNGISVETGNDESNPTIKSSTIFWLNIPLTIKLFNIKIKINIIVISKLYI